MGDSITEGVVESYVKNVGEFVAADEVVARIETDKVTVDILSAHSGVITKYFAEEGDVIEVGGKFLEIDTDAKAPEGGAAPPKQEAPAAAAVSAEFILLIITRHLIFRFSLRRQLPPLSLKLPPHQLPLLPHQLRLRAPHRHPHPVLRPLAPRPPRRLPPRSPAKGWRLVSR